MNEKPVRLGVIGCGGFGLFALQQFAQVPGVELAGMAGTSRPAARAAARRFGLADVQQPEALLRRDDIDLVYVATPPFLHHPQARAALLAGKHVVVEKPLALSLAQADELIAAASAGRRLLVADLMQRYNPVFDAVGQLLAAGALGEPLHAYFENYASDEGLPPGHWFWDRDKSGGIFIEHGVHFFDLLAGWFGPGRVVAAQRGRRPGSGVEEQVSCTLRYPGGLLASFYHGFHQPARLERQELRIVFERGDVTLEGWIPCRVRVRALADEADTRRLCALLPGARLDVTRVYAGPQRACRGRHKRLDAYQLFELDYGAGQEKYHRYGELLRALLADQLRWIRDPAHRPRVSAEQGRAALALALAATALADADEQR